MDRESVTAAAAQAMDETADWAVKNVTHGPAIRHELSNVALLQSLAHYRAAGQVDRARAVWQGLMTRSAFLLREAEIMLNEQWQSYGSESYKQDGYRASRAKPADVSACMDSWDSLDPAGFALYQALVHRASGLAAEAKAVTP